jgi:membrane-bound lytic murein transglycosylase
VPVYGVPADLIHARLGDAPVKPNGQTPFGRYDENGQFVPYYERGEIEDGKLLGRGWRLPGRLIRSNSSSFRCRVRAACARPTAR